MKYSLNLSGELGILKRHNCESDALTFCTARFSFTDEKYRPVPDYGASCNVVRSRRRDRGLAFLRSIVKLRGLT